MARRPSRAFHAWRVRAAVSHMTFRHASGDVRQTDDLSVDLSVHPLQGALRACASRPCLVITPSPVRRDAGTPQAVHRVAVRQQCGFMHPQWRPYVCDGDANADLVAAFGRPHAHSAYTHTHLLHGSAGPLLGGGAWKSCAEAAIDTARDAVHRLRWDDSGAYLYQVSERGIFRADLVGAALAFRGVHWTRATVASALCNAPSAVSALLVVGYRNGKVAAVDVRANPQHPGVELGQLPFKVPFVCAHWTVFVACSNLHPLPSSNYRCHFQVDHVAALSDGHTLVAQDITGTLALFDWRMSLANARRTHHRTGGNGGGGFGGEFVRVADGRSNDVRAVRNFWVSPDETFVVAPHRHGRTEGVAVWDLSRGGPARADGHGRLLRFVPVGAAQQHHQPMQVSDVAVVAPNHQCHAFYRSSTYHPTADDPFPGLFVVASHGDRHTLSYASLSPPP